MRHLLGATLVALLLGCQPAFTLPADASPEIVMQTYLDALEAADCQAAHVLSTMSPGSGSDLCRAASVVILTDRLDPATPTGDERVYSIELTVKGDVDGLRDGRHLLFFQVKRQSSGAWRVTSVGTGP